jgi:hypothetical protein
MTCRTCLQILSLLSFNYNTHCGVGVGTNCFGGTGGRILELDVVGRWRYAFYAIIEYDIDLNSAIHFCTIPHKTHSDPSRGLLSIPPQDSDLEEEMDI